LVEEKYKNLRVFKKNNFVFSAAHVWTVFFEDEIQ
jgi:hypothetical protein